MVPYADCATCAVHISGVEEECFREYPDKEEQEPEEKEGKNSLTAYLGNLLDQIGRMTTSPDLAVPSRFRPGFCARGLPAKKDGMRLGSVTLVPTRNFALMRTNGRSGMLLLAVEARLRRQAHEEDG